MTEELSGIMFPMVARQIPNFKESFEQYAADLKKEAELIMNSKSQKGRFEIKKPSGRLIIIYPDETANAAYL